MPLTPQQPCRMSIWRAYVPGFLALLGRCGASWARSVLRAFVADPQQVKLSGTINHPLSSAGLRVQQQKEAGNRHRPGKPVDTFKCTRLGSTCSPTLRLSDHRRQTIGVAAISRAFQNIRSHFVDVR